MSPTAQRILDEALQLDESDRRELALELLDIAVDEVIGSKEPKDHEHGSSRG